jgi:two-component system response regulator AtoC
MKALQDYPWPGNIRELENMIKKIVIFGDGNTVLKNISDKKLDEGLPPELYGNVSPSPPIGKRSLNLRDVGKKAVEVAEKEIIQSTLQETHWNRKQAAKLLRVSYKALLYKIQKYHLDEIRGYQRVREETR